MKDKGNRLYHYQVEMDEYARIGNKDPRIVTTSLKQIKDSYKEFLEELMLESQEAY